MATSSPPAGWETSATTQQSLDAAVTVVQNAQGAAKAAEFRTWYTAAWAKDPSLTPDQATAAWELAETLGTGATGATAALGQIPGAAATGAENATNTLTTGPLSGLNAIGAFFNDLTSSNLWIRAAKIIVGGALLIVGLVHITGADNAIASAARKVPLPV